MAVPSRNPRSNRMNNIEFRESLAAPVMSSAVPSFPVHRLSPRLIRGAMIVLWVLAAIAAGAGIGAFIIANRPVVSTAPGLPVAKAAVKSSQVTNPALVSSKSTTPKALKISSADSVDQSQLGDFWPVLPAANLQPSDTSNALQPGFSNLAPAQGSNGTDPVVIK